MTILAIDTSTDYLSLAIMRDEKIIARFHRRSHMRHSSLLVPMIDKLLEEGAAEGTYESDLFRDKCRARLIYRLTNRRNDRQGFSVFFK